MGTGRWEQNSIHYLKKIRLSSHSVTGEMAFVDCDLACVGCGAESVFSAKS